MVINWSLMIADSSPDWLRKVPLNVGASLDKVEECRNFNLKGLLGFWPTSGLY